MTKSNLPELPLASWADTKTTLQLYAQIIGKYQLALMPRKNHWWYITLPVNSRGLATHPIPFENGMECFEVQLNFQHNRLELYSSAGEADGFDLYNGLTVAEFYRELTDLLKKFGIEAEIVKKPFDNPVKQPFDQIWDYHNYDKSAIAKYWQILRWVDHVLKEFSGRFYGKTCPVHLYWHSFDLVVTRFNGKMAPPMPANARLSDREAYSHENISFGFWPGDDKIPEPAFYSYTYPAPVGLAKQPLSPDAAFWQEQNGSPMALLKYHDLIQLEDPKKALLGFLESAYQGGAKLAGWPVVELTVPPLSEL